MRLRNSPDSWGIIAQAFHWTIAALVFLQIGIGVYVDDLPLGIERLQWLSRHKSIGVLIFILLVFRLAWRKFNPAPPLPASMPQLERRLATITHGALYVLLLAAPLTGWLHASAAGFGASFFGWFNIPDIVGKDRGLSEALHVAHSVIVWTLAALVVLHAAAALRHGLLLRDGVIRRMLPVKRRGA